MFEFEVIQDLSANDEILKIIKDYDYIIKNDEIKNLKSTNLQFIKPTEYLITYPSILTIFEYKVNEITNRTFTLKNMNKNIILKKLSKFS